MQRPQTADRALGAFLLCLLGALTVAPVVYVLVSSFNVAPPGEAMRFGLGAWREVFSSGKTLASVGYSFLLAIRIPIAIVFAFLIAWAIVRARIPGSRFIEHALWFGFFLPPLPLTIGWILLLDEKYGLLNQIVPIFSIHSIPGILWVHITLSTIPVMVILLAPALRQLDASSEEAADIAGAGTFTTLYRITLPLVAPAVLTALVAGFIRSLEVFEIEQILGTPANIFVYATRVFDLIAWEPPLVNQAMALSALFLAFLLLVALMYQLLLARVADRVAHSSKSPRMQPRIRTWRSYVASGLIFAYILAGIVLPLVVLLLGSMNRLFGFFFIPDPWTLEHWKEVFADGNFTRAATNSVLLGVSAGMLGTLLYALLAWVLARRRIWGAQWIALFTWLPWAVPGIVLGMALLTLMLNTPVLKMFYGTIVPLVVALIIKDMPFGVPMIRAAIYQLPRELEESAQISGARFFTVFRRIVLPLIAPMLLAVFLLMFVATLRDISTVVLLAGPGTRTLSLLMFEFANSGRFEQAAVVGILIALTSLVIIATAFRFSLPNKGS